MKSKVIKRIVVAGVMSAIAFVLNYISIDLQVMKITLYGLPLLLCGMFYGPLTGLLCGLVTGFLCQLFSKYGLTITAPLWMLAPIAWGFISGLISKIFKNNYKVWKILVCVLVTSLVALLLNSVAMIIDGLVFDYPTEYVLINLGTRVITSLITGVIYVLVLYPILNRLTKILK